MTSATARSVPLSVPIFVAFGLLAFISSSILVGYVAGVDPLSVAALRTGFAGLIVGPLCLLRRWHEIRALSRRDLVLLLLGAAFLAAHFMTWISSLYLTSIASSTVLVDTYPCFIALLGWLLLRERVSRQVVIGIVIAVGGSALIGIGGQPGQPSAALGNALALTASLAVALYVLCGRVLRRKLSWLTYVGLLYMGTGAIVTGTVIALQRPLFTLAPRAYAICLAMAVGPQIVGHGSLNYAVKFVSPSLLAILNLAEPVGASILAYFLFGQLPTGLAAGGMLIVLLGIAVSLWPRR